MGSIFLIINLEKISDVLPLLRNQQFTMKAAREGEVGEWGEFNYFNPVLNSHNLKREACMKCQSRGEKYKGEMLHSWVSYGRDLGRDFNIAPTPYSHHLV